MAQRTLLIMRHADAEPGRPGRPDVQRPLTPAGHDRAAAQAAVIAAHRPEVVLCSTALRATQTLGHLDVAGAVVHVEDGLYGASGTGLLRRLGDVGVDVATVLVVGHMPAVGQVTVALVAAAAAGGGRRPIAHGDADGLARLHTRGFNPGTVAVLDLPDPWADLRPAAGLLRHFD